MSNQKIEKNDSFRAATDDLVKTVQAAIEKKELDQDDRDWLLRELYEMICQLKAAKKSPAAARH